MIMKQYDKFRAVFKPKRIDDLNPDCKQHIGKPYEWQASWIIESGQYEGQWACMNNEPGLIGWAPECDLMRI